MITMVRTFHSLRQAVVSETTIAIHFSFPMGGAANNYGPWMKVYSDNTFIVADIVNYINF